MVEGTVMDLYYQEVTGIIDEIRSTEREAILKAARMVAEQVKRISWSMYLARADILIWQLWRCFSERVV